MDTSRTRFLSQTGNQLFNLLADHHHQIGQFVNHHHDMRQAVDGFRAFRRQTKWVVNKLSARLGLVNFDIETCQIAHAHLAHELVALFHFSHAPIQPVGGLLHVGHHGAQQVWNALVHRHFQHLGVDHQQAHITRFGLVQEAQNHGVDTDRFARSGGTGHQHMRHFGQIGHHRVTNDVFSQAHGQHGFGFVVDLRAQNF